LRAARTKENENQLTILYDIQKESTNPDSAAGMIFKKSRRINSPDCGGNRRASRTKENGEINRRRNPIATRKRHLPTAAGLKKLLPELRTKNWRTINPKQSPYLLLKLNPKCDGPDKTRQNNSYNK